MAVNYLTLRSTISYATDGSQAPINSLMAVSSVGVTTWTNRIAISTLTASTITASKVAFSTMTASTIITVGSTITLGQNASVPNRYVQIGTDAVDTVYFDFHSKDSTLSNYSTRIISLGGATTGTGGLNMYASTIGLVATNGVGIGTTAPTAILSVLEAPVNGDVSRKNMFLGLRNATGGVQNAVSMALALGPNVNTINPYGSLDIKLNGLPVAGNTFGAIPDVTVMSIIGNGNVGIGTTNPAYTLDVNGQTNTVGTLTISNASTATNGFLRILTSGGVNYIQSGLTATSDSKADLVFGSIYSSTEWLRIKSTGNVGIGITNPTAALHVNGSLAKSSGTFDIEHPLYPNTQKHLVHSFIEGPRCDLIYRGTKTLVSGQAIIDINKECTYRPEDAMDHGTFEALCANSQMFLQNMSGFSRVTGSITAGTLTITCENSTSSDMISWMVVAERKDPFIKKWDRTDVDGYLITQYES